MNWKVVGGIALTLAVIVAAVILFLSENPILQKLISNTQQESEDGSVFTIDQLPQPLPLPADAEGEEVTPVPNTTSQSSVIAPSTECAGTTDSQLQTCCSTWAEQNDVSQIQCVGEWQFTDNTCNFVCTQTE